MEDHDDGEVLHADDDASDDDASVHDIAVHDASVNDASVNDASVNDASVNDIAVHDASVNDIAVYDIAVHDASVNDIAVYDASVNDASVNDIAVNDNAGHDVVYDFVNVASAAVFDNPVDDVGNEYNDNAFDDGSRDHGDLRRCKSSHGPDDHTFAFECHHSFWCSGDWCWWIGGFDGQRSSADSEWFGVVRRTRRSGTCSSPASPGLGVNSSPNQPRRAT